MYLKSILKPATDWKNMLYTSRSHGDDNDDQLPGACSTYRVWPRSSFALN